MPILKDQRKTKTLKLESYEGAEVEMYTSLLVGEIENFDSNAAPMTQALFMLPILIKSWNFTDENEQPLPINAENIKKLDVSALEEMTAVIEQNKFEAKKA